MRGKRAFAMLLPLALLGFATQVPWEELTEADWSYQLATRFSLVEGHQAHYPTPTAELARLLEARQETAALRPLAEARLALGDRPGALAAMEQWAEGTGPEAWAETARWAASHQEPATAFKAAGRALPGLAPEPRKALAQEQILWADQHPDLADPIALRKLRSELFPEDAKALERWLRALEKAGRLPEADAALAGAKALGEERRLLLRADLLADHGAHRQAFQVLDAVVAQPWSLDLRKAYALRADRGGAVLEAWRTTLAARFDGEALVRLATYLQGKGRGEAVVELLRQLDRRYATGLARADYLLLARLHGELDSAPEAFKCTLAAAHLGNGAEQQGDLAALALAALRAGGRPLPWGSYNDEAYRWVAALDRTPGFWTGGVAFLLTGLDWKEAMERLESEALPERTFATARALAGELARRNPQHASLPGLRAAIMERHVERGEGSAALALLPLLETGPPAVADDARRLALLAARQTRLPLAEELRLMRARLRFQAPDGSRPSLASGNEDLGEDVAEDYAPESSAWRRVPRGQAAPRYAGLLEEALARLESRDPAHRASLELILGELDRLPQAENLWLSLASRLEHWNLDDELGPRYAQALSRFSGQGLWARSARWYAKRNYQVELRRLGTELAGQFRGAAIFDKVADAGEVRVELPDQPALGSKVRLVLWADWVRLKALERFPHSPAVFREASAHLVTAGQWQRSDPAKAAKLTVAPVVVADALMEARRWAILFASSPEREQFFGEAMRAGTLEAKLLGMEQQSGRGPVQDLLLFEGWARLSRFERAAGAGDRLAADYPGDGALAARVLSVHRSLAGLESGHAQAARSLVERTAKALEDPAPLWTALGELEEERGRPEAAIAAWRNLVLREPRNPQRLAELATLLWDYGHDAEALAVVEAGRKLLGRPRFFAFETGVLRENLHDAEGAVREYLEAVRPEGSEGFGSWFYRDQRSLRRLAQLLSRDRVYRLVAARIQGLKPGVPEDERILAACFPLATIEAPDPGLTWDADTWIDELDQPMDPAGRDQRRSETEARRPSEYDAIHRLGDLMLLKSQELVRKASSVEFLEAAETWGAPLAEARWQAAARVDFKDALLARRAALAPSAEEGIRLEVARARFLAEQQRPQQADQLWAALDSRISALPEGAVKLRAEGERAGYLERAKGPQAAGAEWQRLTARYPWSLGLLEARLDFLNRTGQGQGARALLESVLPAAAAGHREAFLERLTREALAASDLGRARRAVEQLLVNLPPEDPRRLGAIQLLARLALKESPGWNALAFARAEAAKLKPERHADLYHELARGADLEGAHGTAMALWIEALNRRTEREWLQSAGFSAARAGKGPELLAFFDQQRAQSPRDVRWAVAVRELRTAFHLVEGAIEAAKAAVSVRPEQERLWREAAELLVRADRVGEAAAYLEGWNRTRPADEGVARWRGALYAQAGEGDRALALEAAALAAFTKEQPGNRKELAERRARAAERLLAYGYPALALKLCSPRMEARDLAGTQLAAASQCTLALLNHQFLRLLEARAGDEAFREAAAQFLENQGRPEQREEVQAWVVNQLAPGPGKPGGANAALRRWWPLVTAAGLERGTRLALGERLLAAQAGPWQQEPSLAFAQRVGGDCVAEDGEGPVFRTPELWRLWAQELVRRDRPGQLVAFLEPRWQELLTQVRGSQGLSEASARQAWSLWLDDPAVLATWVRGAALDPGKVSELSQLLGNRRLWDRFWVLAARKWEIKPLVAILPQEARVAWFRLWEPLPGNAQLLARRTTGEAVTAALGRLLKGEPGAAQDALIVKLRGPRTVGEVLGQSSAWLWPDYEQRRTAKGESLEQGEDRILGQGADRGRLPGALWGDRPGEAWQVLETLARYRQGDSSAALVPLDLPQRGGETARGLLALKLARVLGDHPLALELEASQSGPGQDRSWLEARVAVLVAAGQKDRAEAALQAFVREGQGKLTEEGFRWLGALAEEQGLPRPLALLDPERPVGPVFLAYLKDRSSEVAKTFHTADPVGLRLALANRWRGREAALSRDQLLTWLRELWATDSAPLPRKGLLKLGGLWAQAGDWLEPLPVAERAEALEALAAPKAEPRLLTLLSQGPAQEASRLLAVRTRLARGERDQALGLVDAMLAEVRGAQTLALPGAESSETPSEDEEGEAAPGQSYRPEETDPVVTRLRNWLAPFGPGNGLPEVAERFRKLLKERRQDGPVSTAAWKLALTLATAGERPGLVRELDEAWFRGAVGPEQAGPLAATLAEVLPSAAPLWLSRWPRSFTGAQARERARILVRLKDAAGAARVLFDTRRRALWELRDEVQAFDAWRGSGAAAGAEAPAAWAGALPHWNAKAGASLGDRLKAHPQDLLAARSALRNLAPGAEDTLFRVGLALETGRNTFSGELEGDLVLLRLKAARGLRPGSWRAARAALGNLSLETELRTMTGRRYQTAEVDATLADLARLASQAGLEPETRAVVELLTERRAAERLALRTELALAAPRQPEPFRVVEGQPRPLRPRDLSWSLLAQILKAEKRP